MFLGHGVPPPPVCTRAPWGAGCTPRRGKNTGGIWYEANWNRIPFTDEHKSSVVNKVVNIAARWVLSTRP